MKYASLILALPLLLMTACGGAGDTEDEAPALIVNPIALVSSVVLETTPSFPGIEIHGEGINEDAPTSQCGHIKRFNGYPDDTHLYFRIEDAHGLCFGTSIYYVVIENIEWKGIPGSILLSNVGDPATRTDGEGTFFRADGARFLQPELKVTQFPDEVDVGVFWLKVPLSLFNFASDPLDLNSTFNTWVVIRRRISTNPDVFIDDDWTGDVQVDYVKPS